MKDLKVYYTRLFLILISGSIIFLAMMSFRTKDTQPWWYVNGEPFYWLYQQDVFAVRLQEGASMNLVFDEEIVERVHFRADHRDKLYLIYFSQFSLGSSREAVKDRIRQMPTFVAEFPVITLFPEKNYKEGLWFVADDLLLINYKEGLLTTDNLQTLMSKYGLELYNTPTEQPGNSNPTCIFKMTSPVHLNSGGLNISQMIFENDSTVVSNVQPNLIQAFEPVSGGKDSLNTSIPIIPEGEVGLYIHVTPQGEINIKYQVPDADDDLTLRIYDLLGRIAVEEALPFAEGELTSFIPSYAPGIYIAVLENNTGKRILSKKFM